MEAVERVKKEGVPVNVNTVKEMIDMAEYLGMDVKEYFGDFKVENSNFNSSYFWNPYNIIFNNYISSICA